MSERCDDCGKRTHQRCDCCSQYVCGDCMMHANPHPVTGEYDRYSSWTLHKSCLELAKPFREQAEPLLKQIEELLQQWQQQAKAAKATHS